MKANKFHNLHIMDFRTTIGGIICSIWDEYHNDNNLGIITQLLCIDVLVNLRFRYNILLLFFGET